LGRCFSGRDRDVIERWLKESNTVRPLESLGTSPQLNFYPTAAMLKFLVMAGPKLGRLTNPVLLGSPIELVEPGIKDGILQLGELFCSQIFINLGQAERVCKALCPVVRRLFPFDLVGLSIACDL
jgi:hypothetical protein